MSDFELLPPSSTTLQNLQQYSKMLIFHVIHWLWSLTIFYLRNGILSRIWANHSSSHLSSMKRTKTTLTLCSMISSYKLLVNVLAFVKFFQSFLQAALNVKEDFLNSILLKLPTEIGSKINILRLSYEFLQHKWILGHWWKCTRSH